LPKTKKIRKNGNNKMEEGEGLVMGQAIQDLGHYFNKLKKYVVKLETLIYYENPLIIA